MRVQCDRVRLTRVECLPEKHVCEESDINLVPRESTHNHIKCSKMRGSLFWTTSLSGKTTLRVVSFRPVSISHQPTSRGEHVAGAHRIGTVLWCQAICRKENAMLIEFMKFIFIKREWWRVMQIEDFRHPNPATANLGKEPGNSVFIESLESRV